MTDFIRKPSHKDKADSSEVGYHIDVNIIWHIVYRRKWSILSFVLVIMLVAILVVWSMAPVYRATVKIFVDNSTLSTVSIDQVYSKGKLVFENEYYFLQSLQLAKRVVEKLDLVNHPLFNPAKRPKKVDNKDDKDGIINLLKGMLPGQINPDDVVPLSSDEIYDRAVSAVMECTSVENKKGTIISLYCDHENQELAVNIVNTLALEYIKSRLDKQNDASSVVISWINDRLDDLKLAVKTSQHNIQQYREQNNIIGLSQESGLGDISQKTEWEKLSDILLDKKIALEETIIMQQQAEQLKASHGGSWRGQLALPEIANNDMVKAYIRNEIDAKVRLVDLKKRYGEKHPDVIAASSTLTYTTGILKSYVESVLLMIEQRRQLFLKNKQLLEDVIKQLKDKINRSEYQRFKLMELQQELDTNLALYETFLSRLKETMATSSQTSLTVDMEIVESATLPLSVFRPNKKVILFFVFLLSVLLGSFLAFIAHIFDNRLRLPEDVEQKLGLPVLGILPISIGAKKRDIVSHLALSANDRVFAESIMSLRTSLILAAQDRYKSILITSSKSGEGKTIVSSNLALVLGQVEKVLLIDMDMRKPTLAHNFDLFLGTHGIADLLADNATVEECIHSIEGENIDVMSAGMVPPNPLSLILSDKCEQVIRDLASRYDRIIIDAPPIGVVSDALALSRLTDAALYVINSGHVSVQDVQRGIGELLQNKASVLGVVMNRMKKRKSYGYYYYGLTNK